MNLDILNLTIKIDKIKKVFNIYIWFAFLFYSISFFGGGGVRFHEAIPWYVLISRDIVWFVLLMYFGFIVKNTFPRRQLWETEYGRFLKIFAFLCGIYLVIVSIHLTHRDLREIIQHDIRNILSYSLILLFLPFIFQKKEDIYSLINTFLKVGMVLSLFGIATRYIPLDFLTWHGRIVSTMSDPNNLGIFLSFCILLVVANWESLGSRKAIPYFLVYSLTLVLANSISAFLTVNFALVVMLLLKKGWVRGFVTFLAVFYIFICFSFITKIVENPNMLSNNFLRETYNVDKYIIDKLNNISRGKFSKLFFFIEYPLPEAPIRSLTQRRDQFISLKTGTVTEVKEILGINKVVTLLGNFELKKYATFDNQYLNFIINTGVVSTIIFFGLFIWGGLTGMKSYFYFKKTDKDLSVFSLLFSIFLLSMTLIAFNGAAFLNRFPLNFLTYLSFGMIFLIQEIHRKNST